MHGRLVQVKLLVQLQCKISESSLQDTVMQMGAVLHCAILCILQHSVRCYWGIGGGQVGRDVGYGGRGEDRRQGAWGEGVS